jgi:hypothetical protein
MRSREGRYGIDAFMNKALPHIRIYDAGYAFPD